MITFKSCNLNQSVKTFCQKTGDVPAFDSCPARSACHVSFMHNYGVNKFCWEQLGELDDTGCCQLFNAELSLKRYWQGPESQEVGGVG